MSFTLKETFTFQDRMAFSLGAAKNKKIRGKLLDKRESKSERNKSSLVKCTSAK